MWPQGSHDFLVCPCSYSHKRSILAVSSFQDPVSVDEQEFADLIFDTQDLREIYLENAAMAVQLTKPKGGKRKAGSVVFRCN